MKPKALMRPIVCSTKKQPRKTRGCFFVLQHRKRYGLHAMSVASLLRRAAGGFNTASGMDCMQCVNRYLYIKEVSGFNTASGMDCMQFPCRMCYGTRLGGFNTASGMDCMQYLFDYGGHRS